MKTFRLISFLFMILVIPISLNAQKTMQNYLYPVPPSTHDTVSGGYKPFVMDHPDIIVAEYETEFHDEEPQGPVDMSFGEIPYSVETTQTGNVHLKIPINSYANEKEFAPELSLDYNSGRNSFEYLGKGWKLDGLPVVSRVSKDFFAFGNVEGISLTDNYSFALDGERLIYQNESVDTIRFIGQTSNIKALFIDNDRFLVQYPDGRVATMSSTDSINYCVTSLKQKDGQEIRYEYADYSGGNGHGYISKIYYGEGKRMDFNYALLDDDVIDYYCVGKCFKKKAKLNKITILNNVNNTLNDTITHYILWRGQRIDSPIEGVEQYFKGGKSYFFSQFDYLFQSIISDQYTTESDSLSYRFLDTNPADFVMQRGRFSHYSEGEGLLMFMNRDSYYYDDNDNIYKTEYEPDGKIIVAHNSNCSGIVPCSVMDMEEGFVDAFPVNADGAHGEEIVKINNRKQTCDIERLSIKIYSADNDTLILKDEFYVNNTNISEPLWPKTFLTGDFDGDGSNELLIVEHKPESSSLYTPFKLVDLRNGAVKCVGAFQQHVNTYFPIKTGWHPPIDSLLRWQFYKNSDRLFTIDHNGDGKVEIGIVNPNGLNIYELFFDYTGNVSSRIACSKDFPKVSDLKDYGMRVGEFNGDGIADILFYLETDTIQPGSQKKLFISYLGRGNGTFNLKDSMSLNLLYTNGFYPTNVVWQTNRNGLSDAIVSSHKAPNKISLYSLKMRDGSLFAYPLGELPDSTALVPAYFYGECGDDGFLAVGKDGLLYKHRVIIPRDARWHLKSLLDSYHNSYSITYRRIYESDNYHPDFGKYQSPYTTYAKGQMVCHSMKKYDTSHNLVENRIFGYGNAVMHEQGFGYIGFDSISVVDTVNLRTLHKTYNISCLGAPLQVENYKSVNRFSHELTITPDRRILLRNTGMSHYDKATCSSDTTCYIYDQYGNVTLAQTTLAGGLEKTIQSQYINQTDGSVNIIGLHSKVTTTVTNANGSVVSGVKYSYNSKFLPLSEKKFFGDDSQVVSETQLTYDSKNRVIFENTRNYNSPWLTKTYSYSGDSRKPLTITDSRGWSYDMYYGKFGLTKSYEYNVLQQTPFDPIGGIRGDGINSGDHPIDPEPQHIGLETSYEYDEAGNIVRVINPDGTMHIIHRTWVYNNIGIGAKYFVTDSVTGQPVTRTYYNSLGQKTRVETQRPDGSFLKVDYEYDAMGRLYKQYEPYKTTKSLFTLFEYDGFDRIVCKTYPDLHSDTYSYNGLTTSGNVGGISSSKTVDVLGNLVSVIDPGGTITYSMTSDGRPLSININGVASTTFEYDSYGRKTAINDPSAGRISYTYDSSGNIATVTDARGKTTTTTYNDFGKPTSSSIGNDMTVIYTYNDYYQPSAITCSNGNCKQYTYNKYHKLKSETINGFKKSYNYSGGNVVSIGYSLNGTSLGTESYTRTRGTVTAINYGGKTLWQLNGEDESAMPTAISSSVVSTELEYDDLHRVTSRIAETNNSGIFHDMEYEYDAYGNLIGREDGYWNISENFDYDNLNRLVSTPTGDITYDGKGNITELDAAGVFGYASSRPYALDQITLSVSDFPTASQTISFNSINRPDTIIEGNSTAFIKYFEDGERSQMTITGTNRNNVYKYYGGQLTTIDYTSQSYEGQKQVLFLGGDAYTAPAAIVREKENGTNAWSQSLYYIVRDNLGSIVHVVDSTGLVAQELSYDAWGRMRAPNTQQIYASGEQPELILGRGYCGHEYLADFNLINMNARLYDPWTARFLSPDPYVQLPDFTQSLNRYSYCLNNPLKYVDPSGKIIDESFMTPIQRIHFWHDIWELRKNKLFNTFYDRIQKSSQIIYVMYGRTHSSDDESPSEANFDYRNNTIYLGMSYDKWDLTEELYHAYQHINNTLRDGHNADYEANVVRLLSIIPIATPFESLTEMGFNIALGIYGTDETGSFTKEKEEMFITDYINYGKLFINEPGRDPYYHIPVISCPPLLLELLRTVFK